MPQLSVFASWSCSLPAVATVRIENNLRDVDKAIREGTINMATTKITLTQTKGVGKDIMAVVMVTIMFDSPITALK